VTERAGPGDALAEEGAAAVRAVTDVVPEAAIVMGSGLAKAVAGMEEAREVPYEHLPGFPEPTVPGHAGALRVGTLGGVPTTAFLGRIHYYEGHTMSLVTLPVRLAAALGAGTLVVTAAVGGLDPSLEPGSLVVGVDHLNFLGENPLRGWRGPDGRPPFVDLSAAYDTALAEEAIAAADAIGLPVARGVYAAMSGPSYETPAEIAFLRRSGATVVGMSVVPEALAAAALGLRCVGLFCVTNQVGGRVTHAEVTEVAGAFAPRMGRLLERLLPAGRGTGKERLT
jgi:purine-nucleoside phosphorylase